MEPSLFSLLVKRITSTIIAIGSLFYSTINGVNAEFDNVNLSASGGHLFISARLTSCFSEELDRIFQSGQEIKIHYLIQVFESGVKTPIYETAFYNSITYSLVDQIYGVYSSEKSLRMEAVNIQRAKEFLSNIENKVVLSEDQIRDGKKYFIKLSSFMGEIQLPGMEGKLNLMFYWNSLRPTHKTDLFDKDMIIQ